MYVFSNDDGSATEYPSITSVNQQTLDYWASRANDAKHPVLKARYADLVWDLSKPSTGDAANISMAQIAIDSILDIANQDLHVHDVGVVTKLERALPLAISTNDPDRIKKVRDVMIAYENKVAVDDSLGLWGFSYDNLVTNTKVLLTEPQKDQLIHDLEDRLERVTQPSDSSKHPWAAEAAATRLASFYHRRQKPNDVERVLLKYSNAFKDAATGASPLQASAWLQQVHAVLVEYDFTAEAKLIAVQLRDLGPKVNAEMKPISASMEISVEDMKRYVDAVIAGDLNTAFARIASYYVPKKEAVEDQIRDLAKKAPISFLIPRQIQDDRGRPVATVGSLDNDLVGHIVIQVSQNMYFSSIFLRRVMEALIQRNGLTSEILVSHLYLSPIFEQDKREIIKQGFQAYLEDDHLVATHLLIPQIENAIRALVEKAGGYVLRRGRNAGLQLRLLDELLRDQITIDVLGEDVVLYFRILLTDQRGWNLRNNISHGLMKHDAFGAAITDRIIHSLLCLALVRAKETD
jgi:hypothetical protein